MGVVYRARDRQLDEVVALKLLRPEALAADPTLIDRFKQEIKLARRITHRNVLRTHDFGEAGSVPYISMEFLEGVTLKDLIRNRGALPLGVGLLDREADVPRARRGARHGRRAPRHQAAEHADPARDRRAEDHGLRHLARAPRSRPGTSGLTTAGTVMGTPDYMPPEQAQGKQADFRSDIYSLGVVLFEIFTGKLPFRGDNPMAVVVAHIQQLPPQAAQRQPEAVARARGPDPEGPRQGPRQALADDRRAARSALRDLDEGRSRGVARRDPRRALDVRAPSPPRS